jgi:hypothetical protein
VIDDTSITAARQPAAAVDHVGREDSRCHTTRFGPLMTPQTAPTLEGDELVATES